MSVVTATTDRQLGSASSRRLRREGRVPAVIYGRGGSTAALSVDYRELREAVQGELGLNTVFTVAYDGQEDQVIIQDLQRDILTRLVSHVDLLRVSADAPIKVRVPIHVVGDGSAVTENGGRIEQKIFQLDVLVTGLNIPPYIEVDISGLTLDGRISVGDVDLPEGVTPRIAERLTVVAPVAPKGRAGDDEALEGEEGEEGVEATDEAEGEASGGDSADASED